MSSQNINGYVNEQTVISDNDWFDIDAYLGVDNYESKKVSFGTIRSMLAGGNSNIYNTDGTLTGDRLITGDNKALTVSGARGFTFSLVDPFCLYSMYDGQQDRPPHVFRTGSNTDLNNSGVMYESDYTVHWDSLTDLKIFATLGFVTANGSTANRPTHGIIGQTYFDTDLGYRIDFNGTNWVNSTGQIV